MAVEDLLRAKREENLRVCAKYGAYNVQVFGSVARVESDEQSDIDLIVDFEPGRSLLGPCRALARASGAAGCQGGCGG
jgi:predicted nucleotidyltransferase